VTLTQGIYGQVLEGDDVTRDEHCTAYAQPRSYPVWLETTEGVRVAEDVADVRGAFELVAAGGEYTASGRTRYDIVTGVLSTFVRVRAPSLCASSR
jgi:hypothetical protein